MDKQALRARYPQAFAWLAARNVEPSDTFYARLEALRGQAWTVAKLATVEQIEQVKTSLIKALQSGQSFAEWQKALAPDMLALPKHYRETVFRNAVQASYNGAKWAHFRDNPNRPILRYVAVNDGRTRPAHKALHGLMMPMDDPRWQTLAPSNGFGCRCTLMSLSERQAKAMGYDGAPQELPTWTDKHGDTHVCQPDKGWAHSPENHDLTAYLRDKEQKAGLSRAIFDAGKTDAPVSWTPPPPDGSAESQIRYDIITRGQVEGVEYAAIVGEGGLLLAMVRGEAKKVGFTQAELASMRGATLYHNHPSATSFSAQDILFAADYGLAGMVVYGTYEEAEYRIGNFARDSVLKAALYDADAAARKFVATVYRQGKITQEEALALRPHLANMALDRLGVIKYDVVKMSMMTQASFAAHQDLIRTWLESIK